ncbi:MAG: tetratricopeptide repeat protein [Chitinophagaceae bacterium]
MRDCHKITELLTGIKTCHNIENVTYFERISDLFVLLSKTEQIESVQSFYSWAEENAIQQPLKHCYAKFLLAHTYFLTEQHESAFQLIVETQKLFEEKNDAIGIGCCLVLQGGIYRTLGNFDLALRTLWQGYQQLKGSGKYSHFLSACSYNLGSIYFESQNIEEAIHHFKNTLEQSEKARDRFWSNYALHGLGKVYLQQKKYPEAKEFFEKALICAEEDKRPLSISNSLTELANYHFSSRQF